MGLRQYAVADGAFANCDLHALKDTARVRVRILFLSDPHLRRAALESDPRVEVVDRLGPGGQRTHSTVVYRGRVFKRLHQIERSQKVFGLELEIRDDFAPILDLSKSQEYTQHELDQVLYAVEKANYSIRIELFARAKMDCAHLLELCESSVAKFECRRKEVQQVDPVPVRVNGEDKNLGGHGLRHVNKVVVLANIVHARRFVDFEGRRGSPTPS